MKHAAIILVRIYQWTLRPLLGQNCRFYPTCSDYSLQALERHGFFYGSWLTVKRLCKCHPWHPGGTDHIPE